MACSQHKVVMSPARAEKLEKALSVITGEAQELNVIIEVGSDDPYYGYTKFITPEGLEVMVPDVAKSSNDPLHEFEQIKEGG